MASDSKDAPAAELRSYEDDHAVRVLMDSAIATVKSTLTEQGKLVGWFPSFEVTQSGSYTVANLGIDNTSRGTIGGTMNFAIKFQRSVECPSEVAQMFGMAAHAELSRECPRDVYARLLAEGPDSLTVEVDPTIRILRSEAGKQRDARRLQRLQSGEPVPDAPSALPALARVSSSVASMQDADDI